MKISYRILLILLLATQELSATEQPKGSGRADSSSGTAASGTPSGESGTVDETSSVDTWNDDRFYIAPFGTYMHSGGARRAFDGWGGGMAFGKVLSRNFNIEIRGFWISYGNNNDGSHPDHKKYAGRSGGHTDFTGGSIDLQYHFMREVDQAFSPYLVASLGGGNTSYRTSQGSGFTDRAFLFQFGIGTTWEVSDFLALRADVRYQLQDNRRHRSYNQDDPLNDLVVNLGFVVPLGDRPPL